ncbi:DNA mismatch repair protein MutS2 [Alkalithermobacter thermoalcaliphilus JW-YL-7 = DSM 7308]|uniref:Endonuclease MutS2 n=1 Tax=Alkalithermobacter thermoalcaliphilus JW-YL-7 = DSM 7308 TaxID=1121328 RepID=A0A150FQ60_CLOPD|nr:MutS2 protein [[Clostridium] paradoxum JW-YL-7 = DSM 7308]SHK55217.1 DNA mismatch repair protein MutS2 [[Clostridium] paradoxum JW-YL-7 = DSM 7308]
MNEKTLRVLEYNKIMDMLKEKVVSSLGLNYIENLKPSSSYDEVLSMLDETSQAESILIKKRSVPLEGLHDIKTIVKKASIGSTLDPKQLLMVADTIRCARLIKNFIKAEQEQSNYEIIHSLIESLYIFKDIEDLIYSSIENENEISDNASTQLKSIRRQIVQKNEAIRSKLNSIISSSSYQKYLQENIVTIRADRFVIPVKQEYRSNVEGIVHDQSASGATLFIEPMVIVNMNNELRELKIKEKEEIERILKEISDKVGSIADNLISNQEILGKLDFIFAKGKLSISMKAICPKIDTKGYINIKNGRHPLLDQQSVVPTNIWLGKDFDTLVITGPNTGGKTVTLKTVGLFQLMIQSGLHIPADCGTIMSVFDNIFADIGDEQSIEQSLSTFSSHMTNIVNILNEVTDKSLVLFDELGAGTDPVEGAALAMAILDYLHNFNVKTVATTHYSELKHYALTKPRVENASVEFDVETLSPTYKLLIGIPGKSNAFEISRKLGLSEYIIENAKKLISRENIEFEEVLQNIEENKIRLEKERLEAEKLRDELENLKKDYEEKVQALAENKEKMIQEAKKESQKIILSAKEEVNNIIKQMKKLQEQEYNRDTNKEIENIKAKLSQSLKGVQTSVKDMIVPKVSKKELKDIKIGDEVKVVTLNQQGTILSIDNNKKEALVQIGIMKMNLPFTSLEKIDTKKNELLKTGTGKILKSKSSNIKTQIDLRGKNLDEAMECVDKYLDDSYLAGLDKVTIIHGIGTGVLKNGIKQMLKKHKHVKDFRDGVYGEGGAGVTIVQLK